MMKLKKLRARQAAMFAKHHGKARPYDYARDASAEKDRFRVFRMFHRGMTDDAIARITGMSVRGVGVYRSAVYSNWLERQKHLSGPPSTSYNTLPHTEER